MKIDNYTNKCRCIMQFVQRLKNAFLQCDLYK